MAKPHSHVTLRTPSLSRDRSSGVCRGDPKPRAGLSSSDAETESPKPCPTYGHSMMRCWPSVLPQNYLGTAKFSVIRAGATTELELLLECI